MLAATALMIDYVLNVAVGISAGVGALTSAVPVLHPYTLELCLGILALITLLNLRGTLEAALALGKLHCRKKEWVKAEAAFTEAIKLNPECAEAYHRRAGSRFNAGKVKESLPDFDMAARLDPNALAVYRRLAEARTQAGDTAGAQRALAEFERRRREREVQARLAQEPASREAYREAIAYFEAAKQSDQARQLRAEATKRFCDKF